MRKFVTASVAAIFSGLLVAGVLFLFLAEDTPLQEPQLTQERIDRVLSEASEDGKSGKEEMKKARYEYFFRMLRDPATNTIPQNIRAREIRHAKTLPSAREVTARFKAKNPSAAMAPEFTWDLAGPPAVGGRTRALGIDQRDPDIIIAGGVSGGIWKSTDGGASWDLKTPDAENFSVTSLTQDPTDLDTWYYTSGEFIGNTPGANGAPYFGSGVFVSTDNGETWSRFENAGDDDNSFNSPYDFVTRIVVNPNTGSRFIASNAIGIYRSTTSEPFPPASPTPSPILGDVNGPIYSDVAVSSNGTLAAVLSSDNFGETNYTPGIHISTDDGDTWEHIDYINTFPSDHARSVLAFAPSSPDILYVLTQKIGDATNQGVSFHQINLATETFSDRSVNLPDFGDPVGGMSLQGGYNMVVAVKPDDPDYVFVGGINLFRSTDGFATQPAGGYDNENDTQKDQFWIGGYDNANNVAQYPNQHADQHVIAFDPTDPNRMWAGTDGGVHVTDDVTTSPVSWTDRNEGYIVTQFYAAALPESPDDTRFMGGTQDNGTPFFDTGNPDPGQTFDISSGDGAYSFFSENYLFVSSQQGRVIRWNNALNDLHFVYPSGVTREELLFINPYTIDPNDENVMYYVDVDHIWRNTSLDDINDDNSSSNGTSVGWANLNDVDVPDGYIISALEVTNQPADILYYAGSSGNTQPLIRKLENARTNTTPEEINLPNLSGLAGAYVHDIAANPVNGNEVIAILSNYNVPGIWHSTDGGDSWTNIEGNLNVQSIRSATIIPSEEGMVYVVGTSTGIYSTRMLEGTGTEWGQEGVDVLGYSVVEQLASRISNGDVAAGTHGRGMFHGSFQGSTAFPFIVSNPTQTKAGETITISAANFNFNTEPTNNEILFQVTEIKQTNFCVNQNIEAVPGRVVDVSGDGSTIEVEVPAGILPDECAVSNSATITANIESQDPNPAPIAFSVLPPDDFALDQNYPNPFNPTTTIPINLAVDSRVTVAIYDMLGQKVIEPVFQDEFIAGSFTTTIDLSNLASGVYIYRVVAEPMSGNGEPFVDTRKMTLIK